ncbi:MAG: hypothetical protein BRC51_11475 [Cyanobacteria bacterium SW_12_48_29]|nr:MAG: hypothetical protein BRC51_11475 [Cyanobacteria bacterium SW_12_48_29]
MAAVLVATIGTRDLMFQVSSGEWYNIGDDQMRDGEIIGEQAEVIADLNLEPINYRNLTKYLLDQVELYQKRIRPVIIGKLLTEQAPDTIYACELLKSWLEHYYPQLAVEVISLGEDGTNPANFEQMFRWWRQTWNNKVAIQNRQPIWVCLKGGVGQSSEASRVSGLSLYGDRIQFYEFNQNLNANRAGTPSDYSGPFLGINYLWDRKQQEALALLQRYDYEAVKRTLQSAFQNADGTQPNGEQMLQVEDLVEAAVQWNQGNFQAFAEVMGERAESRSQEWWWTAYEAAYLAVVRFQQSDTIEAMFHSFRAVEGLMCEWAIQTFANDVVRSEMEMPLVRKSIARNRGLQNYLNEFQGRPKIPLYGANLDRLVQLAKPNYRKNCRDIIAFWDVAKPRRNQLFHRLLGLGKREVFQAWDAQNQREWESRVLGCLNFLSEQNFTSLADASLMSQVHEELREAITNYQP